MARSEQTARYYQNVGAGGLAYVTTDYWEQIVYGTADYTYVESGAAQYVESGGHAYGTEILSGGAEYVYSGGVDSASVISSGGKEYVYKGGLAHPPPSSRGARSMTTALLPSR